MSLISSCSTPGRRLRAGLARGLVMALGIGVLGIGVMSVSATAQGNAAAGEAAAAISDASTAATSAAPSVRSSGVTRAPQRVGAIDRGDDPLAQPISLAAPRATEESGAAAVQPPSNERSMRTMFGGLAVCVGAFLLIVWATRRAAPRGLAPLPSEVVEPLGRAALNGRQYLQLVRLGRKLVLLCVSPQSTVVLAEVADADEVARLAGLCQQARPQSVTSSFREVLGDYAREPSSAGPLVAHPLPDRDVPRRHTPRHAN